MLRPAAGQPPALSLARADNPRTVSPLLAPQELARYGIDSRNIVINQVIFPEAGAHCPGGWGPSTLFGGVPHVCFRKHGDAQLVLTVR